MSGLNTDSYPEHRTNASPRKPANKPLPKEAAAAKPFTFSAAAIAPTSSAFAGFPPTLPLFPPASTPASFAGFASPSRTPTPPAPKPLSTLDPSLTNDPSLSSSNVRPSASTIKSVGIASSGYSRTSGELNGLINGLRSAGASAEIDLPRIAVIGNQSAGKSSLIEAISGITLPRDSGTCTRAPMEVRLRHSTHPWSCRISLRMKSQDPSQPATDTPFGPPLLAPALVEAQIRKAQLAVLNPGVKSEEFVKLSKDALEKVRKGESLMGTGEGGLRFTDDVVCVDIEGPQVTDLAFVDLPGIISSADLKNRGDIGLTEDLVEKYIQGNCLILCSLTMKDDIENQKAHILAREFDPEGTRTVGVLTKADMIEDQEHSRWFFVLCNESS